MSPPSSPTPYADGDLRLRPLSPEASITGEGFVLDHWASRHPDWIRTLRDHVGSGGQLSVAAYGRRLIGVAGLETAAKQGEEAVAALRRHLGVDAPDAQPNVIESPTVDPQAAESGLERGSRQARWARRIENALLAVEFLNAFGRSSTEPWADSFAIASSPHFRSGAASLELAWQDLLIGLPGTTSDSNSPRDRLAARRLEAAWTTSRELGERLRDDWARALGREEIAFNHLGWDREIPIVDDESGEAFAVGPVPAYGYVDLTDVASNLRARPIDEPEIYREDNELTLARGDFQVILDAKRGRIVQILSPEFRRGVLSNEIPLFPLVGTVDGKPVDFGKPHTTADEERGTVTVEYRTRGTGYRLRFHLALAPLIDALDISVELDRTPTPDPGLAASLRLPFRWAFDPAKLRVDGPGWIRNVPDGCQMFAAHGAVDSVAADDLGVLVLHDGSPCFERQPNGFDALLHAVPTGAAKNDASETHQPDPDLPPRFRLIPHRPLRDAERLRLSLEFLDPLESALPCFEERLLDLTALVEPDRNAEGEPRDAFVSFEGSDDVVIVSLTSTTETHSSNGGLRIRLVNYSEKPFNGTLSVRGTYSEVSMTTGTRVEPLTNPVESGNTLVEVSGGPHQTISLVFQAQSSPQD